MRDIQAYFALPFSNIQKVVNKNSAVDDPGACFICRTGEAEYLSSSDVAGGVDEYCAYEKKQNTYKYVVNPVNFFK